MVLTARNTRERRALAERIEALGGYVSADEGDQLYADLPVDAIKSLAEIDEMDYAQPQRLEQPFSLNKSGKVISEGVDISRALRFHKAGITGKGIKVGILDFGFRFYQDLQSRGELPEPVAIKTFGTPNEKVLHGTACAEIIHDMAPDAQLYIAAFDGRPDNWVQAAQWLLSQGVDIISYSGGSHWSSHDGRSSQSRIVDRMVRDHGVLWVVAAGNEGQKHWVGDAKDANGNGLVDNPGGRFGDAIPVQIAADGGRVLVNWEDWGGDPTRPSARQDLDAYLVAAKADGTPVVVARSENPQQGRHAPLEVLGNLPKGSYLVVLKATRVNRPVRAHIYVHGGRVIDGKVARSIGIPATAKEALAVGAVDVLKGKLEAFSSQGPTADGRLKPEVVAPDNNTSLSYTAGGRTKRFTGTSAACPHVSGYAALIKSMNPAMSVAEVRRTVIGNVRDLGQSTPNNRIGHGHIDGGRLALLRTPDPTPPAADQPPPRVASSPEGDPDLRPIQGILDLLNQ